MPLYVFKCEQCGKEQEIYAKSFRIDRLIPCKDCEGIAQRIISETNFILKGSGWSKDGYQKS